MAPAPAIRGHETSVAPQPQWDPAASLTASAAPAVAQPALPELFGPLPSAPDERAPQPAVSSDAMKEPGPKPAASFWFNVNAELIIYGATEPTATVRLGTQLLTLREDGTFSLRLDLPAGSQELVLSAVSAAGDESRAARLNFHRQTTYYASAATS